MTRFTCIYFIKWNRQEARGKSIVLQECLASSNDLIGIITKLIIKKSMMLFFFLCCFRYTSYSYVSLFCCYMAQIYNFDFDWFKRSLCHSYFSVLCLIKLKYKYLIQNFKLMSCFVSVKGILWNFHLPAFTLFDCCKTALNWSYPSL